MANIHNSQHNPKKIVHCSNLYSDTAIYYGHSGLLCKEKSKFEPEEKKFNLLLKIFQKKKISRFIFCFDIKFLSRDLILKELISGKIFKFKFSPVRQNLSGKFGCPVLSGQETHMPSPVDHNGLKKSIY